MVNVKLFGISMACNPLLRHAGPTRHRATRGFTLLEALIAMFIISLALFAVYTKLTLAAKIAVRTEQSTYGRWVAMNAITELRLKPGLPDTGRSDGDEEMAGHDFRWTMEISSTPVEGLRRAEVSVALSDSPDRHVFKMSAFLGTNNPNPQPRPWAGIPDGGDLNPTQPGGLLPPQTSPNTRQNPRRSQLEPSR